MNLVLARLTNVFDEAPAVVDGRGGDGGVVQEVCCCVCVCVCVMKTCSMLVFI
jgi:hypothetical protein